MFLAKNKWGFSVHKRAWIAGLALGYIMVLLAWAAPAQAEPYMAVRDGYKCSKCHVNKTGGGKRSGYASVYMQTRMAGNEVSAASANGASDKEAFAHSYLNPTVSIGADVWVTYTQAKLRSEDQGQEYFNRPSECESCHQSTSSGGKLAEVYLQMEAIPEKLSVVAAQNLLPSSDSREVYALVEGLPLNGYVKAGTFRLPVGLANSYDDPFFHGNSRQGHGFKNVEGVESFRDTGAEFGWEPGALALSLSITDAESDRDNRYMLMGYTVGGWGMAGLTYGSAPVTPTRNRAATGVFVGSSLGAFTGLLQMNNLSEEDSADKSTLTYSFTMVELNMLFAKGHNIKLAYEYMDPDTTTEQNLEDRLSLIYEPFFTPNLQARFGYRTYYGPEANPWTNQTKLIAALHVFY